MFRAFSFLVLATAAVLAHVSRLPSLSIVASSHYLAGQQIGMVFRQQISAYWTVDDELINSLIPFYQSPGGKEIYDGLFEVAHEVYPQYCEELEGIADGVGKERYLAFLMAFRPELMRFVSEAKQTATQSEGRECTDVWHQCKMDFEIVVGHNEDASPDTAAVNGTGSYLLTINFPSEDLIISGLSYPGMLLGNTFSVNNYGIFFTTNALSPLDVPHKGVTRYFMNRDLLTAKTIDEALSKLNRTDFISGFSLNLGSVLERRMINVEMAPNGQQDVLEYRGGMLVHTNHYLRLMDVRQQIGNSSYHRYQRAFQLSEELNFGGAHLIPSMRATLGDVNDTDYPIYRTARAPDTGITLASVIIKAQENTMCIFVDNPDTSLPVAILPLALGHIEQKKDKSSSNEDEYKLWMVVAPSCISFLLLLALVFVCCRLCQSQARVQQFEQSTFPPAVDSAGEKNLQQRLIA
eukprot:TRINITY_DN1927_c0_g1_i1.p1 TRINITY_DN1927_c0_g1~~TRINITY_DN1927_c0_g1_i1.p1  ORF type:complete len:464 (-),score=89.81 TRINITY_DN1927_c0_g1_i1:303-1694(-)